MTSSQRPQPQSPQQIASFQAQAFPQFRAVLHAVCAKFFDCLTYESTRNRHTTPHLKSFRIRFYAFRASKSFRIRFYEKHRGRGGTSPFPQTTACTSAASTSTATDLWISSSDTTTRSALFFCFRIPCSPVNGPP